jgi:hypothetical protein
MSHEPQPQPAGGSGYSSALQLLRFFLGIFFGVLARGRGLSRHALLLRGRPPGLRFGCLCLIAPGPRFAHPPGRQLFRAATWAFSGAFTVICGGS